MFRGARVLVIASVVLAVGGLAVFAASQEPAAPEGPRARRGPGQPAIEGPGQCPHCGAELTMRRGARMDPGGRGLQEGARPGMMGAGGARPGAEAQGRAGPKAPGRGEAKGGGQAKLAQLEKQILAQVRKNRPELLPKLKELKRTDREAYVEALRDIAAKAKGRAGGRQAGAARGAGVEQIRERVRDLAAEFRTAPAERRAQIRKQLEGAVSRLIDVRHQQRKAAVVKAMVARITEGRRAGGTARPGAGRIGPQARGGRLGPGAGQRFGEGAPRTPRERFSQAPQQGWGRR